MRTLTVLGYTVIFEYRQVYIIATSSQSLGLGFAAHLRSTGTGHVFILAITIVTTSADGTSPRVHYELNCASLQLRLLLDGAALHLRGSMGHHSQAGDASALLYVLHDFELYP